LALILVFSFLIEISILFLSCSVPVEPLNRIKYSVFSILSTSARVQQVLITSAEFHGSQRVSGAIVEINGVRLNEDTLWKRYTLDSIGFVKPGEVYELRICIGNYLISGTTIVPDSFEIVTPNRYTDIKVGREDTIYIDLKWSRGIGSGLYIIEVLSPPVFLLYPDSGIYGRWKILEFFTYDEKANVKIDVKRYGFGDYIIRVCATDHNYLTYSMSKHRFASAGVVNSYGLFASMTIDSVIINITR